MGFMEAGTKPLKDSEASPANQTKHQNLEAGKMPTAEEYRMIAGSPLKDAIALYTKDTGKALRMLETSVNLNGVSKDGKQLIVEALAPKVAAKERNLLVAHAVQGSEEKSYQQWEKKINGMNNEQARAFLKKEVGGPEFDRVSGGLSWGNVCNELKKLPLEAPDIKALQNNGYNLK